MQARVYLEPLANAAGSYQPAIQLGPDILRRMKLTQRLNKSKWSVGLLYPALDSMELDNSDGRFDTSAGARSVFALAGADRARVRVDYPTHDQGSIYETIYRGQVATKASSQNPLTGKATWKTRTPDIAFVDQTLNVGLIQNGMTLREAIAACFADLQIAASIPNLNLAGFYDPNPQGTIIRDEEKLLGDARQADLTLEKLLLAGDNVLTYVPYLQEARVMRRADSARAAWTSGYITNPLEIHAIEDGVEQVYNVVSAATGVTGNSSTLVEEDRGSISRWGRRRLSMDLTWVRDLDQCDRIVKNLLARLKNPQRVIELSVPSLTADGSLLQVHGKDAIVGGVVGVDIPARCPRSSPRAGRAICGTARTLRPTHGALAGSFYIESIERDLRLDVTKLSLREFIGV